MIPAEKLSFSRDTETCKLNKCSKMQGLERCAGEDRGRGTCCVWRRLHRVMGTTWQASKQRDGCTFKNKTTHQSSRIKCYLITVHFIP